MRVIVRAPSTTANLGPGFDVFGLAVNAFYDTITLAKTRSGITIITDDGIPTDPDENTAGLVVKSMKRRFKISGGIEITIRKGVPAGFGMGSSAASAASAAVAFDELYGLHLDNNTLVEMAGIGEKASAGTIHYDNVSASVLGGFVLVQRDPLNFLYISPPSDLRMCIGVPKIIVPKRKTQVSRSVLPKKVTFEDSITNLTNATTIVAGFIKKDSDMISKSIIDVIVEPARKHMIPGFDAVKQNALKSGADGVTISGAGPSIIAFTSKSANLEKIRSAMLRGFKSVDIDSQIILCKPSRGAIHMKRRIS